YPCPTNPYFTEYYRHLASEDSALFSILAPFSPESVIILLYIWVAKLGISFDNKFSKRLKSYFSQLAQSLSYFRPRISSDSVNRFSLTDRQSLLFVYAQLLSVVLVLVLLW